VQFITAHADAGQASRRLWWGVEPIRAVLAEQGTPIAASTYYAARAAARVGPTRAARGDAELVDHIRRVHAAHYGVYGARKVWLTLNREGVPVARCTVERLMGQLAETINGLYKTELIKRRGPWRTVEQVEIATLEWVDWFNHRRLNSYCDDMPPAELETAYYRHHQTRPPAEVSSV